MRDGAAPAALRTDGAGPDDAAPPPPPPPLRRLRWWLAGGAVALLGAGLLAIGLWPTSTPGTSAADVNRVVDRKVEEAIADLQRQPPPSAAVYAAIGPPLVVVQAQGKAGLGSGVIVNAAGDILTSLHVVEGSAGIKVSFSDGTESTASLQSSDPDHDIAVLRPTTLPDVVVPAVLGGGAQVGDETFAVGHPLGLVASLSAGVVSGLDRSFPLANGKALDGMIQFDAAVNPGSSGGPLLNRQGQVIGIVTGLATSAGDDTFMGIGFAVPIGAAGGAAGAPAR